MERWFENPTEVRRSISLLREQMRLYHRTISSLAFGRTPLSHEEQLEIDTRFEEINVIGRPDFDRFYPDDEVFPLSPEDSSSIISDTQDLNLNDFSIIQNDSNLNSNNNNNNNSINESSNGWNETRAIENNNLNSESNLTTSKILNQNINNENFNIKSKFENNINLNLLEREWERQLIDGEVDRNGVPILKNQKNQLNNSFIAPERTRIDSNSSSFRFISTHIGIRKVDGLGLQLTNHNNQLYSNSHSSNSISTYCSTLTFHPFCLR